MLKILRKSPETKEYPAFPEVTLPNGMKVFCLHKREVPVIYKQIKEYSKYGITINEKDVIFDVGANIGLFSLWTYQNHARNVSIYAFEPIPVVFDVLQANVSRFNNSSGLQIKAFNFGLSAHAGNASFAYSPLASSISTAYGDTLEESQEQALQAANNIKKLPKGLGWFFWLPLPLRAWIIKKVLNRMYNTKSVSCQLKTISEVISRQDITHIDLLKIDVEKGELDVLSGIKESDWNKIKQAVVEIHDIGNRLDKIVTLFRTHGFSEIKVDQEPLFRGTNIFNLYAWRGQN